MIKGRFKAINHFIEVLDNEKLFSDVFQTSTTQLASMGGKASIPHAIAKLLERKKKIVDKKFTQQEFNLFIDTIRVYDMTVNLELIKDVLVGALKQKPLGINDKMTIGTVIDQINNKLYPLRRLKGYAKLKTEALRKANMDIFFVNFRNAIIHRRYKFDRNNRVLIKWDKNENKTTYTPDNLEDVERSTGYLGRKLIERVRKIKATTIKTEKK